MLENVQCTLSASLFIPLLYSRQITPFSRKASLSFPSLIIPSLSFTFSMSPCVFCLLLFTPVPSLLFLLTRRESALTFLHPSFLLSDSFCRHFFKNAHNGRNCIETAERTKSWPFFLLSYFPVPTHMHAVSCPCWGIYITSPPSFPPQFFAYSSSLIHSPLSSPLVLPPLSSFLLFLVYMLLWIVSYDFLPCVRLKPE